MHIDPWILTFSLVTVVATVWMGFWSARKSKTAHDFFVAGRSVSVGWNASAISGEYLSAASFMGVAGMVMKNGYDALWYPVCYACGYLFLLLFIAGPLRRFGAYTIPDFAEGRYDSPVFRKIAVVFVLFIGFFYTMPQMKGAGTTLAYIFPGLPYWAGVVLVGAVITLNVALGGMKGITLVQAVQYWAKMFAISVPVFVLMAVYGHYGKQVGINGRSAILLLKPQFEYLSFHKPATNLGPTPTWKLKVLSALPETFSRRIGQKDVARYGLPETIGTTYSKPEIQLFSLLSLYGDVTGKEVKLAGFSKQETIERIFLYPTNHLVGSRFVAVAREILQTNGVVLVFEDTREVRFAAANALMIEEARQPLPDKAPRDETWIATSGQTSSVAVSTSMTLETVNGWATLSPANSLFRAEERLKAFFGEARHYAVGNAKLVSVLLDYSQTSGRTVIVHTNVGLTRMLGPLEMDWNDWSRTIAGIEAFLRTNGVALRQESAKTVRVMLPELAAHWDERQPSVRQPLPAKAPADEAWLNPFGPLTTKAAKTAKLSPGESKPYSLLYTYSLIIALVCGTAGLPHILVRFYTNPDGAAAKRTTMWVMILIGVFYLFPPIFGAIGRNLLPELYSAAGAKGTDKIVLELPRILNERFPVWGSVLSGITCAGAFAAFMSTFSGLLVSMTGALAHDVYGRILRPRSTPEQRLRAFKMAAVLVGVVAIILGMQVEQFDINFMVGQAFAIAAASYFPLLFLSAWWRNMTMKGAAAGMLGGGVLALSGISLTSFSDLKWLPLEAFWATHPLMRILCEQPAIWAVPLAITLMIVVSKCTRREVPSDVRMKMLVLHAPEQLGLKQEYIQEHQPGHG